MFADYDPYIQRNLFQGFDVQKQHYYSRGHLTPNNDFSTDAERELTMINTNVAPQWQEFNSQNWVVVESAVQAYSKSWRAYVFTGTGKNGRAFNLSVRAWINFELVLPQFPNFFVLNNIFFSCIEAYYLLVWDACTPSDGKSMHKLQLRNIQGVLKKTKHKFNRVSRIKC